MTPEYSTPWDALAPGSISRPMVRVCLWAGQGCVPALRDAADNWPGAGHEVALLRGSPRLQVLAAIAAQRMTVSGAWVAVVQGRVDVPGGKVITRTLFDCS